MQEVLGSGRWFLIVNLLWFNCVLPCALHYKKLLDLQVKGAQPGLPAANISRLALPKEGGTDRWTHVLSLCILFKYILWDLFPFSSILGTRSLLRLIWFQLSQAGAFSNDCWERKALSGAGGEGAEPCPGGLCSEPLRRGWLWRAAPERPLHLLRWWPSVSLLWRKVRALVWGPERSCSLSIHISFFTPQMDIVCPSQISVEQEGSLIQRDLECALKQTL